MAEIPKLVSSMGRAELDRIFVRGYDLNEQLLGKITFAQMVYLMLVGRMPSAEEGRMIDTMLIVLVDHGMTTGALAARMTYHSAPEALQGAVAAAILGAGSVHLGSSEYCAKMLNDALPPDSKETDLDTIAKNTVEKRLGNKQLIPGIGHGIHTQGDPRAGRLFQVAQETKVYGRYCELLRKIGKVAEEQVGRRLPVNVTGAIGAISMDTGCPGRCLSPSPFSAALSAASPTWVKRFAAPSPAAFRTWSVRTCSTSRRDRFASWFQVSSFGFQVNSDSSFDLENKNNGGSITLRACFHALAGLSFLLCFFAEPAGAQIRKINIAYTATSPYQAPLIIAQEAGLFKKHGLDVAPILTPGGSLGFQAMMGGDVSMVLADGSAAVTSNLTGADIVIIASFLNTFPYSLIALPEIKKVDQLVGGKVAISRFGSATDLSVRMALAKVGLTEKDVVLLQIGTQTARVAALQSKNVQATIITPPFTLTARKMGYNTLIDMAQLNIPFELTAMLTTRAFIKTQREVVSSVIAALAEAIHFYKTEKEPSIKILSKYLQTNDREALEETYREIALKVVPEKPYPTLPGIQTILNELKTPRAKASKPEDFVDSSFVKKLDDEKFFERLYKR